MTALPCPPPVNLAEAALFLDFDGTLIGFAPDPMAVAVPSTLPDLLAQLLAATGGALALVSGRGIDVLDALLSPLVLPAAGLHGLERRAGDGVRVQLGDAATSPLAATAAAMRRFAAAYPGLLVEDKGRAIALHYRAEPALAQEVAAFAAALADNEAAGLRVQYGHMVVEFRAGGADKGTAIADFLRTEPYHGRYAVFLGDDRTDEAGFEVTNRLGGLSIKVGAGATSAQARLPDPAAVTAWLQAQLN